MEYSKAFFIFVNKYKKNIENQFIHLEKLIGKMNIYFVFINNKRYLLQWDFTVPSFFKDDKFKINIDLVSNKETKEYIKSDDKIEYIFDKIEFNKIRISRGVLFLI